MTVALYSALLEKIEQGLPLNSVIAGKCSEALRPSLFWIGRHMDSINDYCCGELLRGSYGAAVEAVSLVSFGLVRPAVLSLRAHYELSLQFVYYKDHPIEWRTVKQFRAQPSLPSINKKYLRDNYSTYEKRTTALSKHKESEIADCYEVLSGIAHGTALDSISAAVLPADLVEENAIVAATERVFLATGETLFDMHLAIYPSNWVSLHGEVQDILTRRFAAKNPRDELDL